MTGYITTGTLISGASCEHAWRDRNGDPHASVRFGGTSTALVFDDPATARETAAACIAAAEAMEALPPAEAETEADRG